ncbi:MAG TPA: M20/M25/M40 family metallo-hydrolase [Vicinamibacterales bacterium]
MRNRSLPALVATALVLSTLAAATGAQAPAAGTDRVDLDALYRIKEEGLQRSQVMDTLWYLTDFHGPRLTNSPNIRAAATWAMKRLDEWGVTSVRQETWGPFGRGWANEKLIANVTAPQPFPLIAFPRAWTPGTSGTITADAIHALIDNDADFQEWTGKLKGKAVLVSAMPEVRALFTAPGRRLTDQDLVDMQAQQVNTGRGRGGRGGGNNDPTFPLRRAQFFAREGVAAMIEPGSGRNDHGAILVTNAPRQYRDAKEPLTIPQLMIASEHYNRIVRLLQKQVPVTIELNVQNRFVDDTVDSFNIVAEIQGTDRSEEIVMLGAHFDSWHAGTGATDNAAGVAATMEAVRILRASGVRMRRTVRLALWTGEEQGLLGSREYVKQQFGDPESMQLKPGHSRLSGYFNMDNGTGAIRGVYLQGNEAVRPVFAAWMEPLRNLGMTTLTIRNTGATDHVAFDEVGLPGFQFIQDPVEYGTHSHHTNMDLYDRIQAEDLMKNSVIIASFVYHAANRDTLLPRKALPRARNLRPNATQ